jgi:hypothetical protein
MLETMQMVFVVFVGLAGVWGLTRVSMQDGDCETEGLWREP